MAGSVVEKVSIDSSNGADSFDPWRRMASDSLLGDKLWPTSDPDRFRGMMRRRWVDDLLFIDFQSTGFSGRFDVDTPGADYIGVGFFSPAYSERVTFWDDTVLDVNTGCVIWDVASLREFGQQRPGAAGYVMIPRSVMSAPRIRKLVGHGYTEPGLGAVLGLMRGLVQSVQSTMEPLSPADAASIRNAVLELLAGVALNDVAESTAAVSDAMRMNVERWIESNLLRGDISPAEAATVHGISVRSLHRMFEESQDSFGSTVRRIRVDRARQDLVSAAQSIQTVAMRWGYADASHFCREFKKTYGLTPSEYRHSQAPHQA